MLDEGRWKHGCVVCVWHVLAHVYETMLCIMTLHFWYMFFFWNDIPYLYSIHTRFEK